MASPTSTDINSSVDGDALLRQVKTLLNPLGIYPSMYSARFSTHISSAAHNYTDIFIV